MRAAALPPDGATRAATDAAPLGLPRARRAGPLALALAAAAAGASSTGAVWWFAATDFGPPLSSPLRAQARVAAGWGAAFGTSDTDRAP